MAIKHEKSQQPNNSPSSQTRRSALKKMLVGTGVAAGAAVLPDKWAKPVVDKVLVPAHAATSATTTTTLCPELPVTNYRGFIEFAEASTTPSPKLWSTIKDAVIPKAHAGTNPREATYELCIQVDCDPATGKMTFGSKLSIDNDGWGFFLTTETSGDVGGSAVAMSDTGGCVSGASIQVSAVDSVQAQFNIVFTAWGSQYSSATAYIGPGDGCPEPPPNIQTCGG